MMLVEAERPRSSERFAQLRQIVIGVFDAGERSRSVDAGRHGIKAVAVVVLAAVGVARPEHQHERLVARLEHWQHDLAGDVGEVGLLRGIRHQGARRRGVAGLAIVAARGRRQGQVGFGQRGLHLLRQRHAAIAAGGIVDHDRMKAIGADLVGMIEHQSGAELADCRRAVALGAGHFQHGFLVEVIAAKMLVGIEDDRIGLEERRDGAARRPDRIAGVDRVAEVAGVPEIVAGRHRRGIGGGESREQRVRVPEIHALVADFGHGGGGLRRHNPAAQTVRHEQNQVAGNLRQRRVGRK